MNKGPRTMCDIYSRKCSSDFEFYRNPGEIGMVVLVTLHFTNEDTEVEVYSFYQFGSFQ